MKKTSKSKNLRTRLDVATKELERAQDQIKKLEKESKNKNLEIDCLNSNISLTIAEKKNLLPQSKKIFDEKLKTNNLKKNEKRYSGEV